MTDGRSIEDPAGYVRARVLYNTYPDLSMHTLGYWRKSGCPALGRTVRAVRRPGGRHEYLYHEGDVAKAMVEWARKRAKRAV